ncbi:putative protein YqiC [Candidatus Profftia lariciata]|uniref:accessory factor UbiK family protein n=1 Tax=Candidatus Profftia lariciata TaxID=1987921 RepID=UPI001D033004|nr:accessory factor UbiK family protein [Candidatus Profftia lariciata]UDG81264.1 putative protein YqiC [Candidatus Profftia lariciata]
MINPKKIAFIARQVQEYIPKGLREFGEDIEKKINQILVAQLHRMDLVNREEFDIQVSSINDTNKKLASIEQRLTILEKKLEVKDSIIINEE